MPRVLLSGATGFVGGALYPKLVADEWQVRCASRDPEGARGRHPDREWAQLDVDRPETLVPALEGCEVAYYLVHSMGAQGGGGDYEAREVRSAAAFTEAAAKAGVERIIYLGGVAPSGTPSKHLRSRLATGETLRSGPVGTVELRAGMIVGVGSESWQIVRDLSMRLPLMVLPSWLQHRSEPVAVGDVLAALAAAAKIPEDQCGCYAVPGPEALTGQEILEQVARLRGLRPITFRVPFVSPRLSSYWIQWVTRADHHLARELVEGLTSDLVAREAAFWTHIPGHTPTTFGEAARAALELEDSTLPASTLLFERTMQRFSRRARDAKTG